MARRAAYAALAALVVAGFVTGSAPVRAQEGPGIVTPGGSLRPFARPLTWLDSGPPDRLPIRERPLRPRPGFAGAAPPPDTRDGLTPSLSFAGVHRRSDPGDPPVESFAALGFGAEYRRTERRWQIQADYYGEITSAEGSGPGIGSHGGFASLSHDLGPRDRTFVALFHSSTEDLQGAAAEQLAGGVTRLDSTNLLASYTHARDRRSGVELGFSALRQRTEGASNGAADTLSLSARGWYFPTSTGRIDGRLSLDRFDLDGGVEHLVAGRLGYRADLGPRMAASAHADLMQTSADDGRLLAGLGGNFEMSWQNARFGLDLERNVTAVPGLSQLVLSDEAAARLQLRMGRGLLADLSAERQRLEILGSGGAPTLVSAVEGQLSYAVNRKLWLWGRLRASREISGDTTRDDARLTLGLSKTLGF